MNEQQTEQQLNEYPDYIMEDVRKNMGLKEDDTSQDEWICTRPKAWVLDRVATWNGLIGYGDTIRGWVADIYGIEELAED